MEFKTTGMRKSFFKRLGQVTGMAILGLILLIICAYMEYLMYILPFNTLESWFFFLLFHFFLFGYAIGFFSQRKYIMAELNSDYTITINKKSLSIRNNLNNFAWESPMDKIPGICFLKNGGILVVSQQSPRIQIRRIFCKYIPRAEFTDIPEKIQTELSAPLGEN